MVRFPPLEEGEMTDLWLFFVGASRWLAGRQSAPCPVQPRIPNSAPFSPSHWAGSAVALLFSDRGPGCRWVPTASYGAA
jgi:hypothetical protein